MSRPELRNKKAATVVNDDELSWRQKKMIADVEEEAIGKEVEELMSWTSMIDSMDEQQLREYVSRRPESVQTVKTAKAPKKRVQRSTKSKCSASQGLMATIWKFHKEDEGEETSVRF